MKDGENVLSGEEKLRFYKVGFKTVGGGEEVAAAGSGVFSLTSLSRP